MKKIVCVGDVFLDVIPSPLPIEKEKILHDGETFVNSITFQRGGCAGNFVAVLKSIFPSYEVEFVSRIGNDTNGDFLIQEMKRYGVTQRFSRDPKLVSAISITVPFNDGERHFITVLGGLDTMKMEDLPENLFDGIDYLAYRGIWFMEPLLLKCTEFLNKAVRKNIPISMDLGFDPYWNMVDKKPELKEKVTQRKQAALNALQYVTYLFGNEREFLNITDSNTLEHALLFLLNKGVKNIIVHRGANGAAVVTPIKATDSTIKKIDKFNFKEIPAAKVKMVNPNGSGDTFDSVFIGQLLDGKTPVQAAAWASASAAYSIQSPAGTKITVEAVSKFIQQVPELLSLIN